MRNPVHGSFVSPRPWKTGWEAGERRAARRAGGRKTGTARSVLYLMMQRTLAAAAPAIAGDGGGPCVRARRFSALGLCALVRHGASSVLLAVRARLQQDDSRSRQKENLQEAESRKPLSSLPARVLSASQSASKSAAAPPQVAAKSAHGSVLRAAARQPGKVEQQTRHAAVKDAVH